MPLADILLHCSTCELVRCSVILLENLPFNFCLSVQCSCRVHSCMVNNSAMFFFLLMVKTETLQCRRRCLELLMGRHEKYGDEVFRFKLLKTCSSHYYRKYLCRRPKQIFRMWLLAGPHVQKVCENHHFRMQPLMARLQSNGPSYGKMICVSFARINLDYISFVLVEDSLWLKIILLCQAYSYLFSHKEVVWNTYITVFLWKEREKKELQCMEFLAICIYVSKESRFNDISIGLLVLI